MRPIQEVVQDVIRSLCLDADAILRRKAFLDFSEQDIARLRNLHEALQNLGPEFAKVFYDHILRFEETSHLIPDAQTLERLKQTQAAYFSALTAGDYGAEYIEHRLRVGIAHQRVGLGPTWYLGAYNKYLSGLFPEIWRRMGDDPESFIATLQALVKIALLDMGLAMETYIHADRQAMSALKEYAEMVFASLPDGLLVLSSDLVILSVNRTFLEQFGLKSEEVRNKKISEVIPYQGIEQLALEVLTSGEPRSDIPLQLELPGKVAGKFARLSITGIRLAEEEEEEERLLVIIEDITEEERLREAARAHERRFHNLVQGLDAIVWEADVSMLLFTFVSRCAETMLGYQTERWLNEPHFWVGIIHSEDRERVTAFYKLSTEQGKDYAIEYRVIAADGHAVWLYDTVHAVIDEQNGKRHLRGVMVNITERKQIEERVQRLAFYDSLTGLPNRALCVDRLKQALATAERHDQHMALLFIDLDRFKEINDTQGHDVGDMVLIEAARRFQVALRQDETLARLGGDEFVVIVVDATPSAVTMVAERLQSVLSAPLELSGVKFTLNASIGIAFYPEDGATPDELFKHADIAMYRAKSAGGGHRIYRAEMESNLIKRLEIARRLGNAIARNELQLYYQPQIELASGELTGAEALLRWHEPEWGWVSPAEFVPIAEERGMMDVLGNWVLKTAAEQIKVWQGAGKTLPGHLAVNISVSQLDGHEVVGKTVEMMQVAGVGPASIELEITESSMMTDPGHAIQVIDAFKAAGFAVSIDDFGTGYSSLSYLKRFAADKLKIDISFVRDMLTDSNDFAIVSTIIAMAHGLGMRTVAEGVEQAAQAESLLALGCDEVQGYYYGKPVDAEAFTHKWLS